jgi:hypothetical protein
MDDNIKWRDFTRTHKAIGQFKATQGQRNGLWNTVECIADIEKADAAERAALQLVQDAFYQDTADINRLDDCRLLQVQDIIHMTDWKAPA